MLRESSSPAPVEPTAVHGRLGPGGTTPPEAAETLAGDTDGAAPPNDSSSKAESAAMNSRLRQILFFSSEVEICFMINTPLPVPAFQDVVCVWLCDLPAVLLGLAWPQ